MKFKSYLIKTIISSLTVFMILFTFGCPANETTLEKSDIQVRITEKKFIRSTCSDNVAEALSIEISTVLQNTTEISGYIDDWVIDFYIDSVLLLSVNKSNYESFACADQAIDIIDKIDNSGGYFTYYGFVQFTHFKNTIPNKVTITFSIKDDSGHTYKISDTY